MAAVRAQLADLIAAQRSLLVASARSGGLCQLRTRSLPDRVTREAEGFVKLVERALAEAPPARLLSLVREQVRQGSFACASKEVGAVFKLWRQLFEVAVARSSAARRVLERVCDELEALVRQELRSWQARRFDLVVVGASAGGVTALEALLASLDVDLPVSLLLVLHISQRAPGVLPLVLARHAKLSVAYAVEGACLLLGQAYVAPPGRHLITQGCEMRLLKGPPVNHVCPSVDVLFESAASVHCRRLISVVLSGTGRDGAAGTVAVREHGGVTLAEDPKTAQFAGMPESAVATGATMHTMPLAEIGPALSRMIARGRAAGRE